VPIPGTTNSQHLEDNFNAAAIDIPADMLVQLNTEFAADAVSGARYSAAAQATVTTERFAFED